MNISDLVVGDLIKIGGENKFGEITKIVQRYDGCYVLFFKNYFEQHIYAWDTVIEDRSVHKKPTNLFVDEDK